ncbi:MAG TPA: MlaD family protein [Dissulfurispiraceae bacterium]|nr:MlaD family protein [Dissulfurispiraceae bacterium]
MFDKKKNLTWAKLKVGLVITIALLILFFTVFFAGGLENIFQKKAELKATIRDVRGLRVGSPVWKAGVEIGTVRSIRLHPEFGTIISMKIQQDILHHVRTDSTATVQTMGLLGDKYIELTSGTTDALPVRSGDTIAGSTQLEMKDLVQEGSSSMEKITAFLAKLDRFLEKMDSGHGTVGKLMSDPALYNNLNDTAKSLARLARDMETADGSLKMLAKDQTLYNRLSSAATSLDDITKKMNEGSGSFRKFVEDPLLYDTLAASSKKLNAIVEQMDAGQGVAGVVLKDKEMANDLKQIVTELKDMMKDMKENPRKYFKFSVF